MYILCYIDNYYVFYRDVMTLYRNLKSKAKHPNDREEMQCYGLGAFVLYNVFSFCSSKGKIIRSLI